MEPQTILGRLLDLAESAGICIRRAPASEGQGHPGGALVRLKGEEILFLDPSAAVGDQIAVVASALRGRDEIEGKFLLPEIRDILDESPRND